MHLGLIGGEKLGWGATARCGDGAIGGGVNIGGVFNL